MNLKLIEPTPFGPVALLWDRFAGTPKVVRVLLTRPGLPAPSRIAAFDPDPRRSSCREIDRIAAAIRGFLAGDDLVFSLDDAALGTRPAFQRSVLIAEHGIPRGRVSTYGLIAGHLGRPGASRAVGNALATNPFPLIVPCHRAVRSDGGLGGFQGGPAMKRTLLELEGVLFDRAGRVAATRFHYSPGGPRCPTTRSRP
jgi:methylated-DNA-[protein]-cysteine S-methyltransferase